MKGGFCLPLSGPDSMILYIPEHVRVSEALEPLCAYSSACFKSKSEMQLTALLQLINHDKHKLLWRENSSKILYVRLLVEQQLYVVQLHNNGLDVLRVCLINHSVCFINHSLLL